MNEKVIMYFERGVSIVVLTVGLLFALLSSSLFEVGTGLAIAVIGSIQLDVVEIKYAVKELKEKQANQQEDK